MGGGAGSGWARLAGSGSCCVWWRVVLRLVWVELCWLRGYAVEGMENGGGWRRGANVELHVPPLIYWTISKVFRRYKNCEI